VPAPDARSRRPEPQPLIPESHSTSSETRARRHDVVLYDGVCGLCNRLVRFILARDRQNRFQFASLQGSFARGALVRYGRPSADLDTVYVIADQDDGREVLLWRSRAVIHMLRQLGGVWRALSLALSIVPTPLLDIGYRVVARLRYRVFGRYDVCPVPDRSVRAKFLD
jgi:predicted DCC family thiol-disulfide oxidoreductase YuxK